MPISSPPSPSPFIPVVISILDRNASLSAAVALLDSLSSNCYSLDVYTFTSLITAYARNSRYRDALQVFDEMLQDNCKPTLITFNVNLNVHERRRLPNLCRGRGSLMSCVTCTYSYHLKCALPPSRATPGDGWSCPECVSPLNEIDKILDCEMRPAKPGTQPKFDKQYLVKWNGLSYLHCTWVPEKDFVKASKSITRLKTR